MDKDKYIKKLNTFKDNFNFISTDSTVLNSLVVKAIEESLKLHEDDEKEFFKYALTLLKKYIKDEINKEYEKDRDELFKRVVSSLLLSKNLDILTKTEIFSNFVKSIRTPIEDDFYKKVLTNNPKLFNYFNNIIVTDGKSIFVDPDLEDYCKPFSSFLELYINSLDSEKTPFLKREKRRNTLSRKEEIEIFRRIKNGDSMAISEFLEYNFPLVKKVASRYVNRGVDFDDLFQQGCIGVLKAIECYDITKGFAFSTYAVNWIKQSITRYIDDASRTIRLPVHLGLKMNKLRVLIADAEKEEGRELTRGELAEKIGVPVSTIDEYYNFILPTVSINSKVGTKEDSELEKFIPDDNDYVSEMLDDDYISNFLKELKLILKDREFDVLCRRNGLLNYSEQTLEEIGNVYNLTRERIRQIEAKAYKKIRRNRNLAEYFELSSDDVSSKLLNIRKIDPNAYHYIRYKLGFVDGKNRSDLYIAKTLNLDSSSLVDVRNRAFKYLSESDELSKYYDLLVGKPKEVKNDSLENAVPKPKTTTLDFVSYFKTKYGIDDLNFLLSVLSEKEIECLKRRYGENLSEVIEVSSSTITDASYIVYSLIPKRLNLGKTSDNLSSKKIPKKEKSNLVNELLDNYYQSDDDVSLEESLDDEEPRVVNEHFLSDNSTKENSTIDSCNHEIPSTSSVVVIDGVEYRKMIFDEEDDTLEEIDFECDVKNKESVYKSEGFGSSVVIKDGVEYRKMSFDEEEPMEESTFEQSLSFRENIDVDEIYNDDFVDNEMVFDEEESLENSTPDKDDISRLDAIPNKKEDFWTEIKPYLIGLRDSLTSIIEIIDEYSEEKHKVLKQKKINN